MRATVENGFDLLVVRDDVAEPVRQAAVARRVWSSAVRVQRGCRGHVYAARVTEGGTIVELVFLTVPPPRSGHVVDFLRGVPSVVQASAVYSGVDVVALLEGTAEAIAAAHHMMKSSGAPIAATERFAVDMTLQGRSSSDRS